MFQIVSFVNNDGMYVQEVTREIYISVNLHSATETIL